MHLFLDGERGLEAVLGQGGQQALRQAALVPGLHGRRAALAADLSTPQHKTTQRQR